jgi:hypothetical protein
MTEPVPKAQFWAQLRWGRVDSVNAKQHTVQVRFEELDGFISGDFGVLAMRPGDYALPPKDAIVLCVMMDARLADGFVLGAFYTDNDAAPLSDAGQRSIASDDLRLGDPNADKFVALANLVKDRLDTIQSHFDNHTHIITVVDTGGATATAATPANAIGSLADVAAENVKAK